MNPATLAIASDFVKAGMRKTGQPLTESLEAYVSLTFARFIGASIPVDMLTVRVAEAMDANAPRDILRDLADECLIACAFFEGRLRRSGTVRHYVGLGQMTYDAVSMTEQAYGFIQMRDVIAGAVENDGPEDCRVLLDRARAGSSTAKEDLSGQNVVVGPWGSERKSGLLWH